METTTPQLTNPFHTIALDIIKKSIKTAVYIDDKIALPFENREADANSKNDDVFDLCNQIYSSFQREKILVEFIRFDNSTPELSDRDLLIVDWNLAETRVSSPAFSESLTIIEKALAFNNIHFICILTSTNEHEYSGIIDSIYQYFYKRNLDKAAIEQKRSDMEEYMDHSEISAKCQDAWIRLRDGEAETEDNALLAQIYLQEKNPAHAETPRDIVYLGKNAIKIDNTFIIIKTKPSSLSTSTSLANALSSQIINALTVVFETAHNISNWLTLAIRNLLSDKNIISSLALPSEVDWALYQHYEADKDNFMPSLCQLWVQELEAYLYGNPFNPNFSHEALAAYFETKKPELLGDETTARNALDYRFNIAPSKRGNSIGFGDVWKVVFENQPDMDTTEKQNNPEVYLMTVSPHCDCARAEGKIYHNYHFVEGKVTSENINPESKYSSFLKLDNTPIVSHIEWRTKIFTLYVPDPNEKVSLPKLQNITTPVEAKLQYVATIKEHYAQRIANGAFSDGHRVGVNFITRPSKSSKKNKTK